MPNLLWNYFDGEKVVVICGEIYEGVPLDAKHIVRWIINTPGLCGVNGLYGESSHIFQYHLWYKVVERYEVKGLLTAIDLGFQLKTYRNKNLGNRKGGAYLVRKGVVIRNWINNQPISYILTLPKKR